MSDNKSIFAFVLMPFNKDFDDIYNLGIKETATKLGITAERLDEQVFNEGMIERIYRQIDAADIIIADMSGKNPNVFYEVGYAHAKDKTCILLTNNSEDIPFDLKQRRHIIYNNITCLKSELNKSLQWVISQNELIRKSQIRVDFKQPEGELFLDEYFAKANMEFCIDIYNDSKKKSPDINAIYFYTAKEWVVEQDGKTCASTKSDIEEYNYRYFLKSPVKQLTQNSWAQLRFTSHRVLASVFEGQELLNTYTLRGKCNLRFATSEGNFDYETYLDKAIKEEFF
jgi:nucleoside 2-deoxyribosyltransferase